jgi:hypothetical protein
MLPFLCNIEDLNEGTLLRPIIPRDETIDPKSTRASSAQPPISSSDNILRSIWKRQLMSAPCHYQYCIQEIIELQPTKKAVQSLKKHVVQLVQQGKRQLSPADYKSHIDKYKLSDSDDNFKFFSRFSNDLGLAEFHLTFTDLIVIKGVVK